MQSIFGSVSTSDIAAAIKAALAEDEDGRKLVYNAEEITILQAVEGEKEPRAEGDRIKALGKFDAEITVKGGKGIRRTILVKEAENAAS